MVHSYMHKTGYAVLGVLLFFGAGEAMAQDGLYLSVGLGPARGIPMGVDATDNDVATTCDGWIVALDGTNEGCDPPPAEWSSDIGGGGTGAFASLALGYRWGRFRVEAEYSHAALPYDEVANLTATDDVSVDKSLQELAMADTRINTVSYGNLFANAYFDFAPDSRLSPFAGFGIGSSRVSIDYFNRWTRNSNPAAIATFDGHPQAEELNRKLAGTTSIAIAKLSDRVGSYQVLAGVNYLVGDAVSLDVTVRRVHYGAFDSGRRPWDQLRSHEPTRHPGGQQVTYAVFTDDLRMWVASLGMTYRF